jgi:hypothetical protein
VARSGPDDDESGLAHRAAGRLMRQSRIIRALERGLPAARLATGTQSGRGRSMPSESCPANPGLVALEQGR